MSVSSCIAMNARGTHDIAWDITQAAAFPWDAWGFEPWSWGDLDGVRRRMTFYKGSMMGETARYHADDYFIWRHEGEVDCRRLFETWPPAADVMMHRFVVLMEPDGRAVRRRSYWLGFRGYLEVYQCSINSGTPRGLRDLTPVLNNVWHACKIPRGGKRACLQQ